MTDRPWLTQALTPDWLSSMPRPSTCLARARWASSAPSPQPISRTREPGVTISAMRRRSLRMSTDRAVPRKPFRVPLRLEFASGLKESTRSRKAAMLGAASQETAERGEEFLLLEQEGIVAFIGCDLDEADIRAGCVEGVDDGAVLRGRVKPVAGEGYDAEAG